MKARIFNSVNRKGEYIRYLYEPCEEEEKSPLLIYIHGAGGRGDDLDMLQKLPIIKEINNGRNIGATIVHPQCHWDTWFEAFDVLLEYIEYCIQWENVDKNRVYLCGSSMGGYTAWQVAMSRPEWFAALVPLCGGGMYWNAERLAEIPIWAFHGALDEVVLPEETIHMVSAVNRKGGSAKLTVYPDLAHDVWSRTFHDENLWKWIFAQVKTGEDNCGRNEERRNGE